MKASRSLASCSLLRTVADPCPPSGFPEQAASGMCLGPAGSNLGPACGTTSATSQLVASLLESLAEGSVVLSSSNCTVLDLSTQAVSTKWSTFSERCHGREHE